MRSLTKLAGLGAATAAVLALSACDNPPSDDGLEPVGPEVTEPEMPPEPEFPPPETAESTTDLAPAQSPPTLPPDTRSSEESVRPESETLFY